MDEFRTLLDELVRAHGGTKQALAGQVGITPSSLSHLLTTATPSIEVCLRLAAATGTSASKLLRAAGKADIADLIEELYGEAATRRQTFLPLRLSPHEEHYLATFRALSPKAQRAFALIVAVAARGDSVRPADVALFRRREN